MKFQFRVGPYGPARTYGTKSKCAVALLLLAIAAMSFCTACSKDTPAATTRQTVTLDPDVFVTDHPELFKTAKAESRNGSRRSRSDAATTWKRDLGADHPCRNQAENSNRSPQGDCTRASHQKGMRAMRRRQSTN